jgi:hypothetical protein
MTVPVHSEGSQVSLARTVESRDGTLPIGATGTVVRVYPGGRAYDVEFSSPFHTVVTVAADALISN